MPVLKSLRARVAIGAMVLVFLSGCDPSNIREVVVDRYTFRVPEKYLVKGSISWLPASQHAGLHFVINPDAIPQEQMLVGIDPEQRCRPKTPPTSNMLSSACGAAEDEAKTKSLETFLPEKVYPHKDITFQWEYRVKDVEGNYQTVATCTAVNDGKDGLCWSISNYKDLIYSVGLRASEIQQLPDVWAKVREMLASWEVGPVANS